MDTYFFLKYLRRIPFENPLQNANIGALSSLAFIADVSARNTDVNQSNHRHSPSLIYCMAAQISVSRLSQCRPIS